MIEKKSWAEFRSTGLFLFINQILHAFGWVLVVEVENDVVKSCYPARTKYRGFNSADVSEAYCKMGKYMKDNAEVLEKESDTE